MAKKHVEKGDEPKDAASDQDASDDVGDQEEDESRGLWGSIGHSAKSAAKSAGKQVDQAAKSATTAKAVSNLERKVSAMRRERKIGKGTLRATHVVAYRGFVGHGRASVRMRVTEEPIVPVPTELISDENVVRTNLRRFVALALPGVKLTVIMGEKQAEAVSDRHGYATARVPVENLEFGWHDYHCVTQPDDPTESPKITAGEVLFPDPEGLIVVSDVDDTVLRTGLTEGFVAVKNTLTGSAKTRRAVAGMSALYSAVAKSPKYSNPPAFLYLSTGPWNIYEMLTEFLDFRGFPKGVLFLTDWAPQERYIMRSGKEHKRLALSRLFGRYPNAKLLLIGDSGQNDPDVYVEVARAHPGRVESIIILDVGEHMAERAEELRAWSEELAEEGITFDFVDNAIDAAHKLIATGLIEAEALNSVQKAYEAEEVD